MGSLKQPDLRNNNRRHILNEQSLNREESIESMEDLHE